MPAVHAFDDWIESVRILANDVRVLVRQDVLPTLTLRTQHLNSPTAAALD